MSRPGSSSPSETASSRPTANTGSPRSFPATLRSAPIDHDGCVTTPGEFVPGFLDLVRHVTGDRTPCPPATN
ncbi:MAG: hypothetical protein R2695_11050 [Acidimicrobiales bacterium]